MRHAITRDRQFEQKLVVDADVTPLTREQYHRLAAALHHLHDGGMRSLVVASAVPREGKTVTAANLALTLSESYRRRVLLVDADLRRPTLDLLFGIPNAKGLGDALSAEDETELPACAVTKRLSIVPAGAPIADPAPKLTSPHLKRLLAAARDAFEWVIVDTPPVVLLPDVRLLAASVDAAILVVRAGSTAYPLVTRAIEAIGRTRIAGIVLNAADAKAAVVDQYYTARYLSEVEAR